MWCYESILIGRNFMILIPNMALHAYLCTLYELLFYVAHITSMDARTPCDFCSD